ncbi:MAG: PorT family protein [Chitinophagaceae bacterium]|nr:PorT family protein [Chitinophagaceae bacterium]
MRPPLLLAILILCSALTLPVYGQKNFAPGYLISLQGDTLNGYINYKDWTAAPKQIVFRESLNGADAVYTALSIRSFWVDGKFYAGSIVQADRTPTAVSELSYSPEYNFVADTVFLEGLMVGGKSLFYYRDKDGLDHFYIQKDDGYTLLLFKKYLRDIPSQNINRAIVSDNTYISQLIEYLDGCPDLQDRIKNTDYGFNSLVDLFKRYYGCRNLNVVHQRQKEKIKAAFGLLAGVSNTRLSFSSDMNSSFDYLTKASYPSSYSFTGGISLDLILPRNKGKWSINNDLLYSSFTTNGNWEEYRSAESYTKSETSFAFSHIKLMTMVRYRFDIGKAPLYINGGITNGLGKEKKNYRRTETKTYSTPTISESKALTSVRTYEQGLVLGLGTAIDKFSGELRYETANGISSIIALKSSLNRFSLLLGYRF